MICYHYTSGQGLFGIIDSRQLHCSNVKFLNDPTEQSYFKEVLEIVLNKYDNLKNIYSTLYNESFHDVILNPTEKYIASFSKNDDSLSMWNYYAKGNGYNIGFDLDSIIKRNNGENIYLHKVEMLYDKEAQIKQISDFILDFEDKFDNYNALFKKISESKTDEEYFNYELEQNEIIQDFTTGIFDMVLSFKHHAYEREEEIRLIITLDMFENSNIKFKVSENGVFIEFISLDLNLIEDLKSVTIHPLNGDLHLQGTKKLLGSKIGNEKVHILSSTIPFRLI